MLTVPETERLTGYWVDLQGLQFEEGRDASWIQAFPVGSYKHPLYGKITMTVERARKMASNVINRVRGIDLAIDFAHKSGDIAAGWVKSAEARNDGLWVFVEWTREAAQQIRDGKWRYFSPEFVDAWVHPQTGEKFQDVLLGGGLTNRPFLKNILPVNLSEVMGDQSLPLDEGGEVVEELLKKLRSALKLAEDASEEEILRAIAQTPPTVEDDPAALSEAEVAKLIEEHPALKGFVELNQKLTEQNQRLAARQLATERRLAEQAVTVKLTEWHSGGEEKKFGLPTALDEKLTSFMLSLDEAATTAFEEILDELVKTGFVSLGEKRIRRPDGTEEDSGVFKLTELDKAVKAFREEDETLSEADALERYFKEYPDHYDAYLTALMNEEVA